MQTKKWKPEIFFIQFKVNKWINHLSDPGDFLYSITLFENIQIYFVVPGYL